MKITIVSMGAMRTSEPAIFQAAFDKGVNYIDTARAATWTDATRGWWAKRSKATATVYVATKVKPGSKEAMIRSIDESLSSLKVDYVDLLQLHALSSAEQVMNTEYREVLAEAKKSGKTRFIGVTTHSKEPDVLNAVTDDPDKLYDTVLVTYNFQKPPEVKAAIARRPRPT